MIDCRFCQSQFKEKDCIKMVEPDGNTTYFCAECMNDLVTYLDSGKAEQDKLQRLEESSSLLMGGVGPVPVNYSQQLATQFTNAFSPIFSPPKKITSRIRTRTPYYGGSSGAPAVKTQNFDDEDDVLSDPALFPTTAKPVVATVKSTSDDDDVPF